MQVSIVAISDTHGYHDALNIPEADILIHAGDITSHGKIVEVMQFNEYLGTLHHPVKIIIAGNHDFCFERDPEGCRALLTNAIYLQDQAVEIQGIRFYGSPWQPWFYDWAFNLQRGSEIREKWDLIPEDTDILITHGPPFGLRDRVHQGEQVGCRDLLKVVQRIKPRLHVFGHIHEGYGITHTEDTTFINASFCDAAYKPRNAPLMYRYTFPNGKQAPI
jgi:Icc-related predicted phosphoesterase